MRRAYFVSIALTFLFAILAGAAFAKKVDLGMAQRVGRVQLGVREERRIPEVPTLERPSITRTRFLEDPETGEVLAYIMDLEPKGFIAVSTDTDIRPIIAYSYHSNFSTNEAENNILLHMLRQDMRNRLETIPVISEKTKAANNQLWFSYMSEEGAQTFTLELASAQQWPSDDTGWLDTTWTQGTWSFENDSCPDDPNTLPGVRPNGYGTEDGRCLTGCVATAMGQIVNYWKYPSSVLFTSSQDYVSHMDPGDGYNERIIPIHAPDANMLFIDYNSGDPSQLTVADLLFACGVSVKMNYSDGGSSAWIWNPSAPEGVDAERAFQNTFGYQAEGKSGYDTDFYDVLENNMEEGQPVLLCIEKANAAHAIVADGFRDTGEFHLNFGWGNSQPDQINMAWYFLPTGMPQDFSVVRNGVVNTEPTHPDLTIRRIISTPNPSVSGQEIQVIVEFANQGNADAGATFWIDVYKDRDTVPVSGQDGDAYHSIGGLTAGATGSTTFTYSYDSAGTKKIWAQIDTLGQISESSEDNNIFGPYQHEVVIDNTPPQVEITSPESGDLVAGTIDITASATDDTGITRVEFYHDDTFIASDSTNSYAVSWDTTEVSDGSCTLKAIAYDTHGLSISDVISVTVDNTDPEALITSPTSGETVSGTIDIEGTAWDTNFKEYILEYSQGISPISWQTITTSTTPVSNDTLTSWNTAGVDDGTYTIKLTCEDEANNTSEDQVVVTVDNTAPTVEITSPASGDILLGVVDLEAAASDNTAITRVEFWYDSNFIASDDSNLYAVSWDTTKISDGTYTLTAKAFDQGENIAFDSIPITVNNTNPQIFVSVYTSDSDIIYKNNETIALVIELKQPVENLSADFSRIDSNGPMVEASLIEDSRYAVSHTISNNNTRSDGFYVIPVTALIFQSFLTDESFVAVLDNSDLVESATESSIKGAQEDVLVAGPSGSSINLTITTSDDTTVTVVKYQDNPHPEVIFPATALPKYTDISISDPEAVNWPVKVEVSYTDEEVASLGLAEETLTLFYWKEAEWRECSNTGVDIVNNIIWANMLQEELTGSPLVPGGNVPPLVEITSPGSGDLVAGIIDITASATDDTGIARLEFWDTSLISSDTVSPYAVSWDTARVSDGTCTLKAIAYDTQGLSATDTIWVVVDNTDPETLITSPASGETVSGTIDIEGTAWDVNFKEYTLEYGQGTSPSTWASIAISTTAVSNDTLTTWNTAGVNDGTYTIKLTCEDEANNTSEHRVVVRVDNAAPQVEITSPESGDLVAGIIDITASATDDTGIAQVEFYYDDTFIASDSINSYAVSWDTTEVSDGTCTLKAVAYDTQGLSATDTILVVVDNTDPEAHVTSPASGETVSGTIDIEGTAWDTHFKEYTLEYGQGTSPATWIEIITSTVPVNQGILANWDTTGLKEGVYLLRLRVRDEADNEGEDIVRVTVEEGPGKFIVYPNPCRVGWLKFANLPQGARVYIYTISGEPVRVLSENSGVAEWDLRNRQGSRVFAGIYIYRVDKTGKVGKFAIIR